MNSTLPESRSAHCGKNRFGKVALRTLEPLRLAVEKLWQPLSLTNRRFSSAFESLENRRLFAFSAYQVPVDIDYSVNYNELLISTGTNWSPPYPDPDDINNGDYEPITAGEFFKIVGGDYDVILGGIGSAVTLGIGENNDGTVNWSMPGQSGTFDISDGRTGYDASGNATILWDANTIEFSENKRLQGSVSISSEVGTDYFWIPLTGGISFEAYRVTLTGCFEAQGSGGNAYGTGQQRVTDDELRRHAFGSDVSPLISGAGKTHTSPTSSGSSGESKISPGVPPKISRISGKKLDTEGGGYRDLSITRSKPLSGEVLTNDINEFNNLNTVAYETEEMVLLGVDWGDGNATMFLVGNNGTVEVKAMDRDQIIDVSLSGCGCGGGNFSTIQGPGSEMVITRADGTKYVFEDIVTSGASEGKVLGTYSPAGEYTEVSYPEPEDEDQSISITGNHTIGVETYTDRLVRSFDQNDRVSSLKLYRTAPGSAEVLISTVVYLYDSGGNLQEVSTYDGDPALGAPKVSTDFYLYDGERLRLKLSTEGYLRAQEYLSSLTEPLLVNQATAEQLKPYADIYNVYYESSDVSQLPSAEANFLLGRIKDQYVQGDGCGCGGLGGSGQGLYSYSYEANTGSGSGRNHWRVKTTEILPDKTPDVANDGSYRVVYTNGWGQVIGSELHDTVTSKVTRSWTKYDDTGRVVMTADENAVTSFNPTYGDLVGYGTVPLQLNRAPGLSDDSGLVRFTEFSTVKGQEQFRKATYVQRGDDISTRVKEMSWTYTDGEILGDGLFYMATSTEYQDEAASVGLTTKYEYTWHRNESGDPITQIHTKTIIYPRIGENQNGADGTSSASSYREVEIYDQQGNLVWTKAGDGSLSLNRYDALTGSLIQTISDVDVSNSSLTSQELLLLSSIVADATFSGTTATLTVASDMFRTGDRVKISGANITELNGEFVVTSHTLATYTTTSSTPGTITIDFAGVPSTALEDNISVSFVTLPEFGQHVSETMEVDALGRATKMTDANGNISYMVYDDSAFENDGYTEVRSYPAWQAAQNVTTGPVTVQRDHPGLGYRESISYTWTGTTPTAWLTNGKPNGSEELNHSQIIIRSFVREFYNVSGQVKHRDEYFSIPGTYTSDTTFGIEGTHFYRTTFSYDGRGNQMRIKNPEGTITRHIYDVRGNVLSTWIGTNDSGGTEADPSGAGASGNNMRLVVSNVYDQGIAGPGMLTSSTVLVAGNLADTNNRTTRYWYDWRGRLIAQKVGDNGGTGESESVQRRLVTYTYDNLGRQTSVRDFDGDTVTFASTAGVIADTGDTDNDGWANYLEAISGLQGKLRAYSTTEYDSHSRPFASSVFSVDPVTGTVGASLVSKNWYDRNGNLVKAVVPGSATAKYAYDGLGRMKAQYMADASDDVTYSDALTVAGDTVLEQAEYLYDLAGNVIQLTSRQRFHNATGTGELSGPLGTGTEQNPTLVGAARVSHTAYYYDAANRKLATLEVGTASGGSDGNGLWIRPSTLPAYDPLDPFDPVLISTYEYDLGGRFAKSIDPRGTVTLYLYDLLGRAVQVIDDWDMNLPFIPTQATQRITFYGYNSTGQIKEMKAFLPDGPDAGTQLDFQQTKYIFGVEATGTNPSGIFSNDLIRHIDYPSKDAVEIEFGPTLVAGEASPFERETFAYNALGQRTLYKDRNTTTHEYEYDILGRMMSDTATTLGSYTNGEIRRLGYTYDSAGRLEKGTSYSDTSGTNISNQVLRLYNGFGQLTSEYQATTGAVITSGSNPTKRIQYTYSDASGGANHSRMTGMIYANGRTIDYTYGASNSLNDKISRLDAIKDSGVTLESYSYLGLGQVVELEHAEPGLTLSYIGSSVNSDAGDQYRGLDRFGRTVDMKWTLASSAVEHFGYGYDRSGNRTWKENKIHSSLSELYMEDQGEEANPNLAYDNLNRLLNFQRGELADSNEDGFFDSVVNESRSLSWNLDTLGNWSSVTTNGVTETRTHNYQNQITSINASNSPGYDANGNMLWKQNDGLDLRYDAWNRLAAAITSLGDYGTNPSTYDTFEAVTYGYDAFGRRQRAQTASYYDWELEQQIAVTEVYETYWSANWQKLENIRPDNSSSYESFVWSPVYIDAMVARDRDADGSSANGLEERAYVIRDANFNVTALVGDTDSSTAGNQWGVVGRFTYDPYGSAYAVAIGSGGAGGVTLTAAESTGWVSGLDWRHLHQGGEFDTFTGLYHFRNRDYDPVLGRWISQDPAGYVDGANLYQYVVSNPTKFMDPLGLQSATTQPSDVFDDQSADPLVRIAQQGAGLGWIHQQLTQSDREWTQLFIETQIGILNELANGACPCVDDIEKRWLANTVRDFISPLSNSLWDRLQGNKIRDAGWSTFFSDLDSGAFEKVPVPTIGFATPPIPQRYAVARAMALNHINNDLKRALQNNGIGTDALWKCIGEVVDKISKRAVGPASGLGQDLIGWWDAGWDVGSIRDQMRDGLNANQP